MYLHSKIEKIKIPICMLPSSQAHFLDYAVRCQQVDRFSGFQTVVCNPLLVDQFLPGDMQAAY